MAAIAAKKVKPSIHHHGQLLKSFLLANLTGTTTVRTVYTCCVVQRLSSVGSWPRHKDAFFGLQKFEQFDISNLVCIIINVFQKK